LSLRGRPDNRNNLGVSVQGGVGRVKASDFASPNDSAKKPQLTRREWAVWQSTWEMPPADR